MIVWVGHHDVGRRQRIGIGLRLPIFGRELCFVEMLKCTRNTPFKLFVKHDKEFQGPRAHQVLEVFFFWRFQVVQS